MLAQRRADQAGWKRLEQSAWFAFAAHLAAGVAMAVVLRRGLESNPSWRERLTFLAEHRGLWIAAWLYWTAAALTFLNFVWAYAYAPHKEPRPFHLKLAMFCVTVGLGADLSAQAVQMWLLPRLAPAALADLSQSQGGPAIRAFANMHRLTVMTSGGFANWFYTVAALSCLFAAPASFPSWVNAAGGVLGVAGLAATMAVVSGDPRAMTGTRAALVPCLLAWLGGVGLEAGRRERELGRSLWLHTSTGREPRRSEAD